MCVCANLVLCLGWLGESCLEHDGRCLSCDRHLPVSVLPADGVHHLPIAVVVVVVVWSVVSARNLAVSAVTVLTDVMVGFAGLPLVVV